ncbi:MAG TPA: mechanosensitive ion channel domain-containing protein [Povalibacter sp.]
MSETFSLWAQESAALLVPAVRVLIIVVCAWLLHRVTRAIVRRLSSRSILPAELVVGLRRVGTFLISAVALLLILQQLGVSAAVLWTGFTGFVTVGAIAFFAAWSVLSNIFCTLLIVTTRPFRLHDRIELLENGDKPGLKGQVTDVNLIYTTLREVNADGEPASVLQVPNSLFFQRIVRRWTSF